MRRSFQDIQRVRAELRGVYDASDKQPLGSSASIQQLQDHCECIQGGTDSASQVVPSLHPVPQLERLHGSHVCARLPYAVAFPIELIIVSLLISRHSHFVRVGSPSA
jgi:hypothetical protein